MWQVAATSASIALDVSTSDRVLLDNADLRTGTTFLRTYYESVSSIVFRYVTVQNELISVTQSPHLWFYCGVNFVLV